ncbi:hypothetical protein THRCLA_05743 [Thraustotheca clavata]|uniref:Ankyrin repeat n=1 Tax=Thraustotheca clavata TaxID=74557 RepID=A0A1V9ZV04_9STRA|nr:hypothetical protein THRCLA_05743 [Thraustotheca clavata]
MKWDDIRDLHPTILSMASPLTQYLNGDQKDLLSSELTKIWGDVFELDWEGDISKIPTGFFTPYRLVRTTRIRLFHGITSFRTIYCDELGYHRSHENLKMERFWPAAMANMWLDELRDGLKYPIAMAHAAIYGGHIRLLDYLIVQYLHTNRTEGCTKNAMDYAARWGYFKTIKYLHENRTEGCTKDAIDQAAKGGYFDIVQYLVKNRNEGCTKQAMDNASCAGFLDIVIYLHENRTDGCTVKAMDGASNRGSLDIVKYLHQNRTEGCTSEALDEAAKCGHLDVVKFLNENRTEGEPKRAIEKAASSGHFDIVKYFLDNKYATLTRQIYQLAVRSGNQEIVDYLDQYSAAATQATATKSSENERKRSHSTISDNKLSQITK